MFVGHHTAMVIAKERFKASGIHLGISICIAALAALAVFALWYPYPYREISGGRELFLILTTVDVILGPLITLAVFNSSKSRRELTMDLAIVGCVQLAALGYGLWTVAVARPVHLVFEFDRLRVVHSVDIPEELLASTPPDIRAEPWTGPTLLAVRPLQGKERFDVTLQALQGVQAGARPDLWETYDAARSRVVAAAQPVQVLERKIPAETPRIEAELRRLGRDAAHTSYLPVISRKIAWTAFIDPQTADVVGFAPLDSF
jgi:hypothetical protein